MKPVVAASPPTVGDSHQCRSATIHTPSKRAGQISTTVASRMTATTSGLRRNQAMSWGSTSHQKAPLDRVDSNAKGKKHAATLKVRPHQYGAGTPKARASGPSRIAATARQQANTQTRWAS